MNRRITSPCTNLCVLDDETGYCKGCLRTIEEIANWIHYSEAEKLEVLEKLKERRIGV